MASLQPVIAILRHRKLSHLADLLNNAFVEFDESTQYGHYAYSVLTTAEIYAPIDDYDRLQSLSSAEQRQIYQTILEIWPPRANSIEISEVIFRLDQDPLRVSKKDEKEIAEVLEHVKGILIAVATGGPRINAVNDEYKRSYCLLSELLEVRGLTNPIPYDDLWEWYGKWSSGDLPTWRSRREYVCGILEPVEKTLQGGYPDLGSELFLKETGWARVDRSLDEVRSQLSRASTEEQFQTVGLLSRETLISLAQVVYDPMEHRAIDDEILPSNTDTKRMLDRYISSKLDGKTNEALRRSAKASLELANDLQHRRTATFRHAALCATATSSIVNTIAILEGVRDP